MGEQVLNNADFGIWIAEYISYSLLFRIPHAES
jgi:hypothetical protein